MVPLSKGGTQISESLCVTCELFLFRGVLMPLWAPESAALAALAVWTCWCWWPFRECVCCLWLHTPWLLSFEWPQPLRHVLGYSTAEWMFWPLIWLSSLSVLCVFHPAQQEVWSDFCCTPACSPLPFVCYSCFSLLLFLFYKWPILGTLFCPLLLEVVLKKPCPSLFFLYCLKAIKKWMCVLLFEDKRIWSVCLKVLLNTMSLICMHEKKRREQITSVTFNLWRVSRITPIPWGRRFPQGVCKGHGWKMAGNKWSETEFRWRGFAWDFLWSSATSHTATFLSWVCCPLTVTGNSVKKIWKGQKISDWRVELAHSSNDAFVVRHHKNDASWLEFGSWQTNTATFWVLERAQIVTVHAKVGIFLMFNSVIKLLSWPDLFALAWKGQKR